MILKLSLRDKPDERIAEFEADSDALVNILVDTVPINQLVKKIKQRLVVNASDDKEHPNESAREYDIRELRDFLNMLNFPEDRK